MTVKPPLFPSRERRCDRSVAVQPQAMEPLRLTLNGRVLDRRAFLGTMGLAAGVVLVGSVVPVAVTRRTAAIPPGDMSAAHDGGGSWHVDDMWGHWPRYAHPIPYSHVESAAVTSENVAPADLMFMT